ncbi:hypothetical protein MHBO_003437 [Bonamia ostreae]|uniref:Glycerol-3-phosphate dehydrogenase NAD-dependent C-terminal domain-containing protein n=1 Tax=Bonamia ostreae TaxID=126728 RepID=A0ABV2AQF4_9EUKA
MAEMQKFGLEFFDDIHKNTFWQSSGFADLITTCYAGRNRKCAQEFAKTGKSWDQIEKEMLGGQKLQGPSTCQEVYSFLENKKKLSEFPLFVQIYKISFGVEGERADPASVVTCFQENGMEDIVMNWK